MHQPKRRGRKKKQVPMMAEIYRNARGSIGYIGSPTPGTSPHSAFQAFAQFAGAEIVKPVGVISEQGEEQEQGDINDDLLDSQWFLRSWVTQEAVISKQMMCFFGDETSTATFSLELLGALVQQIQTPGLPNLQSGYSEKLRSHRAHPAVQVHSW
jgi:Heterokaryon incompatibility protein (HET)